MSRLKIPAALIALTLSACQQLAPQTPAPRETGAQDGQDGNGATQQPERIDDLGPLGSGARSILRPEPFTRVVVELAHVAGREPSDTATSHLRSILSDVTRKPAELRFEEIPAGDGSYSTQEIRAMSQARSTASIAPTASIWIAYLDGQFDESDEALGVAVAATVAAVFPDRIDSISQILSPNGVERSVLLHEVGHLLALVNNGYESEFDHEDPEHPNHSDNRGSVMYWAVETISVANVFRGGPPDNFDAEDRADLNMLAGR